MPCSDSSSGYCGEPERHGHQGRRPRDWTYSSNDSFSRPPIPSRDRDRRSNLSRDYTDRGRDLDSHRHTNLYRSGRAFNPQRGRYAWSSSNESDGFYAPTRIPRDSFHNRRHRRRLATYDGDELGFYERWERALPRGQYRDDTELDYSWRDRFPVRRTDADAELDFLLEGREDDMRRRQGRRESRSHYRDSTAADADYEDNEAGLPDGYRSRRQRERSASRSWQGLCTGTRNFAIEYGLDVLQREYMDRRRELGHPADEGPRARRRGRRQR
ncbi:hypothetical protein G647_03579 [Cladophialophora carrionii CBS 160.54]|uniref:Uncharacterized protein n=1 Tax=Cladophialophora carrionii CBS 160.54 TaxID=1279043 RepID=V9DBJ2_9EURO|nr:uncharacterized protein G647_03579 [Cladophialophora carrionii CBS 160.54]ETI24210.1 hypothetical protein G647_03579 [Cladophialophora carrionii CBS 160.54]